MNVLTTKKITLATVKKFIRENRESLLINVKRSFDGMIDGCQTLHGGFVKAEADTTQSRNADYQERTLGIKGVWLVGSSRDYFQPYNNVNGSLTGIEVSNSCGCFILAIPA